MYSCQVDRSPAATATFLCTYYRATSEIIPNALEKQKVLIPEIPEKLKALHNGPSKEFEDFCKEHYLYFDYQAQPHAKSISLGLKHFWRLLINYPKQQVLPCVYRAPIEK